MNCLKVNTIGVYEYTQKPTPRLTQHAITKSIIKIYEWDSVGLPSLLYHLYLVSIPFGLPFLYFYPVFFKL